VMEGDWTGTSSQVDWVARRVVEIEHAANSQADWLASQVRHIEKSESEELWRPGVFASGDRQGRKRRRWRVAKVQVGSSFSRLVHSVSPASLKTR